MIKKAKDLNVGDGVDCGLYIRQLIGVYHTPGGVILDWDDGLEDHVTPGSEFCNVVEAP